MIQNLCAFAQREIDQQFAVCVQHVKDNIRDWKFLATGESFESEGRKIHGLKLPEPILHKILRENAKHWIHGL